MPFDNVQAKTYYYSWARLSAIKRVDRIVEAFSGMPDKNLIFSYGKNDPEKEVILGKLRGGLWKKNAEMMEKTGV